MILTGYLVRFGAGWMLIARRSILNDNDKNVHICPQLNKDPYPYTDQPHKPYMTTKPWYWGYSNSQLTISNSLLSITFVTAIHKPIFYNNLSHYLRQFELSICWLHYYFKRIIKGESMVIELKITYKSLRGSNIQQQPIQSRSCSFVNRI